jgi:hypothetical protein
MAIRIRLPGGVEIETDSAAEAVEIYHQLPNVNGSVHAAEPRREEPLGRAKALGRNAKAMLKILLLKRDGEETGSIAKQIGVAGAHGLAALTRQIRNWGAMTYDLDRNECVLKRKRPLPDGTLQNYAVLGEQFANKIRGHEKELGLG